MLRILGGFGSLILEITSNLCNSFKRLALPDIISEWYNVSEYYYALLKRLVTTYNKLQSIHQSGLKH